MYKQINIILKYKRGISEAGAHSLSQSEEVSAGSSPDTE